MLDGSDATNGAAIARGREVSSASAGDRSDGKSCCRTLRYFPSSTSVLQPGIQERETEQRPTRRAVIHFRLLRARVHGRDPIHDSIAVQRSQRSRLTTESGGQSKGVVLQQQPALSLSLSPSTRSLSLSLNFPTGTDRSPIDEEDLTIPIATYLIGSRLHLPPTSDALYHSEANLAIYSSLVLAKEDEDEDQNKHK